MATRAQKLSKKTRQNALALPQGAGLYITLHRKLGNSRCPLFLAWQAPASRAWYPVGRLVANRARSDFVFQYTGGALAARKDGFHPISAFPDFEQRYESSELFPLFQNRVIDSGRRGFADYVRSLALADSEHVDPLEILAITGGERQTDNFEVFPKLEKDRNQGFACRFFLHGLRHCSEEARKRALSLQPGEPLQIAVELNNPTGGLAVQLSTRDYQIIGWSPRYLVPDLLAAAQDCQSLSVQVIQNNAAGTPLNRRVLIELSGKLPASYEPMSEPEFQPLPETAQ